MSGLSAGLKNWHWRSKGVKQWSESYFNEQLPGTTSSTSKTRVVSVKDVEGDSDLGMRKSKLVTIYDLKITCVWEGTLGDGSQVRGTLTAVEVAHDMDEDEYIFETAFDDDGKYNSNREAQSLKEDAHKNLANKLRSKFQAFPQAMKEAHGKDLLADGDDASPGTSGAATPVTGASKPSTSATTKSTPSSTSSKSASTKKSIHTAKVKAEAEFQIAAADLFDLLTNAQKVPTWSRNPATIKPEAGAPVELFGGNIVGKVTSVDPPKRFVQTWRAPTWPDGHFGTLTMTLNQGSTSTSLLVELEGVPVGKEDETEKGLDIYYIRSLKQIGSVLASSSPRTAADEAKDALDKAPAHAWHLPNFREVRQPSRVEHFLVRTASSTASVIVPIGLVGLFGWLLYRGPTFQS